MWSDYAIHHLDEYVKRMPKDVVQFNWYYWNFWENKPGTFLNLNDEKFKYTPEQYEKFKDILKCYRAFEKAGFDQIPTGSSWDCDENFENLTEYARQIISPEHLLGFMQTPWSPTISEQRDYLPHAIDLIGKAKRNYRG